MKTRFHRLTGRFLGGLLCLLLALLGSSPVIAEKSVTVTFYHTDVLGSVIATSDEFGHLQWRRDYQPYGEIQLPRDSNDTDTRTNSLGYTGKPRDPNGLVYLGARYYDPLAGRFMAVDPAGVDASNPHSFNRYAYAHNNPYKYVDPDGRVAETAWDIFNIALGAASFSNNLDQGNYGAALWDAVGITIDSITAAIPFVPGGIGATTKIAREGAELAADAAQVTKSAGSAAKKSDDVIHVTKDGVAIPTDPKYKIPDNYVQNPHRSGNYGEIVDGKYKERLRIDPATPPGQKGPNYSHYHKNGKGTHYSPKEGDPDPGF